MNAHLFGLCWFLLIYCNTSPFIRQRKNLGDSLVRFPLRRRHTDSSFNRCQYRRTGPDGYGSYPVFRVFDALKAALDYASVIRIFFQTNAEFCGMCSL